MMWDDETETAGMCQNNGESEPQVAEQGHEQDAHTATGGISPPGTPVELDLEFELKKDGKTQWILTATIPGQPVPIDHDRLNLNNALARSKFLNRLIGKLNLSGDQAAAAKEILESQLVQRLAAEDEQPVIADPEYIAREDPEHPERTGFYVSSRLGEYRLSNFVARITEERHICDESHEDEGQGTVRKVFRGKISCLGVISEFELTAEEYSDKLRASMIRAGGAKVEFLAEPDRIRTAISRNSSPTIRQVTTAIGWTHDSKAFLFPGGFVDAAGCHEFTPECGQPEVDIPPGENARWVRLKSLPDSELEELKRHVVNDLMQLHDPSVMLALLGATTLSVMMPFAGVPSRPLLWLTGLTGAGKSYTAKLMQCFFGAFHSPAGERYTGWTSTGNSLEAQGYYFRHLTFLIDDYKPENARPGDVVRLIQAYSDAMGRRRLTADARQKPSKPIRGMLICTGEDYPAMDASGLGRTILIPVPQIEQDSKLGRACYDRCGDYPGLTADLIAWAIKHGHDREFHEKVDVWRQRYLKLISGKQNDGRIAANHAALAAALELFAQYMGEAWPDSEVVVKTFCEGYLGDRVIGAAGAVEADLPAMVFLGTLRNLIDFRQALIEEGPGRKHTDERQEQLVVGRILEPQKSARPPRIRRPQVILGGKPIDGDSVIGISIPQALSKVQEHLRKQGKPPIQVRESTLIQQLIALGQVVDEHGQLIDAKSRGAKTQNTRLDGRQTRVARFLAATLRESPDSEEPPTGLPDLSQVRGEGVVGCPGSPGSCQPASMALGGSAA